MAGRRRQDMRFVAAFTLVLGCAPVSSYDHVGSAWVEHTSPSLRADLAQLGGVLEAHLNDEATANQRSPMTMRWIGARAADYEPQADGSKAVRIAYVFEWEHRCYLHGERDVVTLVRSPGSSEPHVVDSLTDPLLLGMPGVPTIPCDAVSDTSRGMRLPVGTEASHQTDQGAQCIAVHFTRDFARAKVECPAACEAHDRDACRVAAMMFELGEGVGRDPARAKALYEQACKMGDAESCRKR